MKKLYVLILAALMLTGCTFGSKTAAYRQVSSAEAAAMMETEKNYVIVDVRTPEEFAEGHIPGAVNVPNERIGNSGISELPDKSQLILVYCRSGNRSKQAAEKLAAQGYRNVVEFGGIQNWQGDIVTD